MSTKKSRPGKRNPEQKYHVIGTRPVRSGDAAKVTGQAVFGADISLPDMLYGAVLRSPHAHARILSIDTRQAEAMPGVKGVVTGADLPQFEGEDKASLRYQSQNILAQGKVLYYGHAVAAVAATSLPAAEEALAGIKVTYAVLPHVVEIDKAMREDAPLLHEDCYMADLGRKADKPGNVANHLQYMLGDPQKGFTEAVQIVEREFHTETVHQGYLEPHNATALYDADGRITIWCSTQGSFGARGQVADILQIPAASIRVVPTEIGGGFGGKNNVYLEPLAVLLSKKSGHRPVKMVMSSSDVLAATGPTSASTIRVRMGANREGKITAATATMVYASGAFPGPWPLDAAMDVIFAPYRIENVQVDGYDVVVNRPRTSSYRAPGSTNAVFACEAAVDELCEKLAMDPLEFRLLNAAREGDRRANGLKYKRIGCLETIEAAKNHPHYSAPLGGPHRGRGVATGGWFCGGGESSANATINKDGTVSLMTGSIDLSGTRQTLAMQLAETLGISIGDVSAAVADTDAVGYTDGSWGSRTTFATGWAVYELGQALINQLKERAAEWMHIKPEQVAFKNGYFSLDKQRFSFKELVHRLGETGSPITASTSIRPDAGVGATYGTHIVDIEVDPETGKVTILRYTAVQDVGTAVHPGYVEGQIQGGVTQGIGWALNEEYVYDEMGRLLNANFMDYRIPTCPDVPSIEPVIVEVANPGHPYGVRGVGEIPIVPPPAAIANAIHQALGVRMSALPMSPGRILQTLWDQEGHEG